ncbi:MAG: hypothetical protein HY553_13045 [Elusimicrobia bacterium]|nr:hypothetical protein [Elusimicrobiota bacterium]
MTLLTVLAALVLPAPAEPLVCAPGPTAGVCENLSPEVVRKVFEGAVKKQGLEPAPTIVLAPEQEFVTFDCAAGRAKAGGSNAETNLCGGQHVITVGRSVADMSIACPALGVTAEQTLEAWALHEGAHVKHQHVACRRLDLQRICVAWGDQPAGRRAVTRLLRVQGVASVDQLPPEGVVSFRNSFVSECLRVKEAEFNASAREQEDQADAEAQKLSHPRAMECAMHGAILYLKAIGAQPGQAHKRPERRLLDAEERAAAAINSAPF